MLKKDKLKDERDRFKREKWDLKKKIKRNVWKKNQ